MGCSKVFVAPLNIEGAHVRLIPGILMIGRSHVEVITVPRDLVTPVRVTAVVEA